MTPARTLRRIWGYCHARSHGRDTACAAASLLDDQRRLARHAGCTVVGAHASTNARFQGQLIVPLSHRMLTRGLFIAVLYALPVAAVAQPADTTRVSANPLFTRRDAWTAATFVVTTVAMFPLDRRLAQRLQDRHVKENQLFENAAVAVEQITSPGSYLIGGGLWAVGRLSDNERMADLGWHGTEAILVSTGTFVVLKGLFGRARPETVDAEDPRSFRLGRGFGGGPYASFPSGHAGTAFAAAAAVTSETSRWWPRSKWYVGTAMYGGATMVALSRMYDNKHWASDVVMGAAIGTFAGAKVVRYHHSHPDNLLDRWILGSATVLAAPSGDLALGWTVPWPRGVVAERRGSFATRRWPVSSNDSSR